MKKTLRWRIHDGQISLRRRHLRALSEMGLPEPLMGWIHERLEWATFSLLDKGKEAVLVLDFDTSDENDSDAGVGESLGDAIVADAVEATDVVDTADVAGKADKADVADTADGIDDVNATNEVAPCGNTVKITLEDVREPHALRRENLSVCEGMIVGVQIDGKPILGTVWLERDGKLYASSAKLTSATDTLAQDLAQTLQMTVIIELQALEYSVNNSVFFVSDEFGLIMVQDSQNGSEPTPLTKKMQECFAKLW